METKWIYAPREYRILCCFCLIQSNPIWYIHTQTQKKIKIFKDNRIQKPNTNKLFTARFTGLWRSYKIPETISKSAYQRLKGAYMGYNSFDDAMEDWPEARWGNEKINTIKLHSFYHFISIYRFAFHFHFDHPRSICIHYNHLTVNQLGFNYSAF